MIEVRRAAARGVTERGWLRSRHAFSFGTYHDPQQVGFSDLLVLNEDRVVGGRGYGLHPHRDMEIISYVLEGALEHRDSLGSSAIVRPGDVQMMSAGTGMAHSELNHSTSEEAHFLQIWIVPDRSGVAPRYQKRHFLRESKRGRLRQIVSPAGEDGSLGICQDARVYAGLFDGPESHASELPAGRHAYVHVARGTVLVNGVALRDGDGARLRGEPWLRIAGGDGAELLIFDLRPHESPQPPR